jgi:amino acid transporter
VNAGWLTVTDLSTVKRVIIGRPRATRELKHQLLPKWMALPVFSSDPLSSVAYATEEMMLVLVLAGTAAFSLVLPLSIGVATLLTIVIVSYRQTVRAYPHGGGAYIVAKENLGTFPGLTAASALLIDYTLTVSVSIAAGVAAITSALPSLASNRVPIALGFVILVTVANLRGVKEAGTLFAIPTYTFVLTIFALIGAGMVRCLSECPTVPLTAPAIEASEGLGLFLILRAFSSGATALTGVEAISNGVTAFRYPQSENAAKTLGAMGVMAVSMFLGISFLATHIHGIIAVEGMPVTVNAQIALAVFGDGPGFVLVQVLTAAILILAANTAYADFPRLSSVLAADSFLPRQLLARGDRLVFSSGILVLASLSSLLLVVFGAEVSRLIQLYVVGVFTSFTLSQIGMVRHWYATKQGRWRQSAVVNGIGGATTGVVLIVVAITKFAHGAWIVILAIPLVVGLMARINAHYGRVRLDLLEDIGEPVTVSALTVCLLLDRIDESVARALGYARWVNPRRLVAYAMHDHPDALRAEWNQFAPDIALEIVSRASAKDADKVVLAKLDEETDRNGGTFVTALVAETSSLSMLEVARHHRLALRLKSGLVGRGVVVANLTAPQQSGPYVVQEPLRHHVIVLVSGVSRAVVRALAYAQRLNPTTLTALSINLETERSNEILQAWQDWDLNVSLELVDSPFRDLNETLLEYIRDLQPDGIRTVVTCVLPEFVLPKWTHRPLHNQTALRIKGTLLLEPGVVVTSVPLRLRVQ